MRRYPTINRTRLAGALTALLLCASLPAKAQTYGKLTGSGSSGAATWDAAAQKFIQDKKSTINMFRTLPLDAVALGQGFAAITNDATQEGQGLTAANAGGALFIGGTAFKTPKTGVYAMRFRCKLKIPVSGTIGACGISNVANTSTISVLSQFSVDTTNYFLRVGSVTATLMIADGNAHDYTIIADGTKVTAYVDGARLGQVTESIYGADENMYPMFFSAHIGDVYILNAILGYVGPAFSSTTGSTVTLPDGEVVAGTQMFTDTFDAPESIPSANTNDGSTRWVAADTWLGPANGSGITPPEQTCIRHENATVHDGVLDLAMTNNVRGACTAPWPDSALYEANYGTTYPYNSPTNYDGAEAQMANFLFTYGQIYMRVKQPGGTGPGTTVSLAGQNCQRPYDWMSNAILWSFNRLSTATCKYPEPGGEEQDLPQFWHSLSNQLAVASYVSCTVSPGSPPFQGTVWGLNYCGGATVGHPTFSSDPTTNWHVYMTDWRPGSLSHWIDGKLYTSISGVWIPNTPEFLLMWNEDQNNVTGATLTQSMQVDWIVIVGPPNVPWVINHQAAIDVRSDSGVA